MMGWAKVSFRMDLCYIQKIYPDFFFFFKPKAELLPESLASVIMRKVAR